MATSLSLLEGISKVYACFFCSPIFLVRLAFHDLRSLVGCQPMLPNQPGPEGTHLVQLDKLLRILGNGTLAPVRTERAKYINRQAVTSSLLLVVSARYFLAACSAVRPLEPDLYP
jgi:hypothetical protein